MLGDGELLGEIGRDEGREKQGNKGQKSTLRTEVLGPSGPLLCGADRRLGTRCRQAPVGWEGAGLRDL